MPNTTDNNKLNQTSNKASTNPGNFKNDPQRASEAGQKGGQSSKSGSASKSGNSSSSR